MARLTACHRDTVALLLEALGDLVTEVNRVRGWGWPHPWVEYEQHADRTVADAGAYLAAHPRPELAELLHTIEPIVDAYWPGFPPMTAVHDAVQKLRRVAAEARYGLTPDDCG